MATLKKKITPAKQKLTARDTSRKAYDATALLRADHKQVSNLFAEYEKAQSSAKKMDLVSQICTELSVHAQVEEEIFYPAVKLALQDKVLVPEATVEHATLKALIAQVEGVIPDGEMSSTIAAQVIQRAILGLPDPDADLFALSV